MTTKAKAIEANPNGDYRVTFSNGTEVSYSAPTGYTLIQLSDYGQGLGQAQQAVILTWLMSNFDGDFEAYKQLLTKATDVAEVGNILEHFQGSLSDLLG